MHFNEFELNLTPRDAAGTSGARALRKQNKALVSVYGKDFDAKFAFIPEDELSRALASKTLFNKFTNLNLGKEKVTAFAKIIQRDPVTDRILHIDFQAVKKGQIIKMKVPIKFINEQLCEDIKLGGMLNVVCSYVELTGKVDDMPAYLECDLKDARVKVSINISTLKIPGGIKLHKKYENKVIATVLAARKKGGSAAEEAAAASA